MIRTIVKAILSVGLIGATCVAVIWTPESVTEGGLALLGGLSGSVVTHYFQKDPDLAE